jgi:quinol monooxygenase YgiN
VLDGIEADVRAGDRGRAPTVLLPAERHAWSGAASTTPAGPVFASPGVRNPSIDGLAASNSRRTVHAMAEKRPATSGPVVLTLRGRTKAGKREDLFTLFETHLAPRAEKNGSQPLVVWAADRDDADRFSLIEIYDDAAAAMANAEARWFADYVRASIPLLDGVPEMTTGTPKWVKGVNLSS